MYGIKPDALGIAPKLLEEKMTLVPFKELANWLSRIETLCGDENFMLKIQQYLDISQGGIVLC